MKNINFFSPFIQQRRKIKLYQRVFLAFIVIIIIIAAGIDYGYYSYKSFLEYKIANQSLKLNSKEYNQIKNQVKSLEKEINLLNQFFTQNKNMKINQLDIINLEKLKLIFDKSIRLAIIINKLSVNNQQIILEATSNTKDNIIMFQNNIKQKFSNTYIYYIRKKSDKLFLFKIICQ